MAPNTRALRIIENSISVSITLRTRAIQELKTDVFEHCMAQSGVTVKRVEEDLGSVEHPIEDGHAVTGAHGDVVEVFRAEALDSFVGARAPIGGLRLANGGVFSWLCDGQRRERRDECWWNVHFDG